MLHGHRLWLHCAIRQTGETGTARKASTAAKALAHCAAGALVTASFHLKSFGTFVGAAVTAARLLALGAGVVASVGASDEGTADVGADDVGPSVGAAVGASVGASVGAGVGACVGAGVAGSGVGVSVGVSVGTAVVGAAVVAAVGAKLGDAVALKPTMSDPTAAISVM